MPVNLIIRNPLDWDALAIARNANGANRRELSDYVRFLKSQAVWNDLGFFRDFANAKSLNHSFGPNINFTRNSVATYFDASGTLRTAAVNEPRFDHNSANNNSLGLLIEESRTNLLERSAEFENAYWTKIRSSVTANSTTAPDGTTSADTLVEDTSTNTHNVYRPVTHTGAASTVTYSIFAKQKERPRVQFDLIAIVGSDSTGVRCTFNLSNGTAGSVLGTQTGTGSAGTGTASITNVGNGWYRCALTLVPAAGITPTSNQIYVSPDNGTTSSYTGDGTSGIFIWGAQLEVGAFPTSYIPTTTAAATRSADSAVVTPISSFYNQSEGTLFAEGSSRAPVTGALVGADDNTGDNQIRIVRTEANARAQFVVRTGNVEQANLATGTSSWASGATVKVAMAFNQNDIAGSLNGAAVLTDTSATIPAATHFYIGRVVAGQQPSGHIRKIAYWPKRLSNALLQQLTT